MSSVVLPAYSGDEYLKKIKKMKGTLNVFVGKEYYSNIDWMYQILGLVPPYLITRVRAVIQYGIFNFFGRLSTVATENTLNPAIMIENFVIISVVWLFGIFTTALCVSVEMFHILPIIKARSFSLFYGKISSGLRGKTPGL